MSRTFSLMTVLAVASLGFWLAGCEMNETCDPATDPGCEVTDSGGDTGGDTGTDQGNFQTYHYVLLEDLDDEASGPRPGADIDGVELRSGGQSFYLAQIHDEGFGGEQPPSGAANRDWTNAVGTPEAQCIGRDDSEWDLTTFVSLGGTGGFFVGRFTEEINTGDIITVHACSDTLSNEWQITVGVADSLTDPTWEDLNPIGTGVGVANFTVPNLPNIPQN